MMHHSLKFDKDRFFSPDIADAPVYIWVWNDLCTRERIDTQLSEMQRLGIRAFYILPEPKEFRPHSMPTHLAPGYLSEEYFDLCAYAVEKGSALGMRCWIYDEGGWPSGGACGQVLRDHPEYARQVLRVSERAFTAGDVYKPSSPDVLASFVQDRERIWPAYRFKSDVTVTEYRIEREISGDSDYPDLLCADAADYFIRITHEKYAASLKDALGKTVTAVFTDEPKAPSPAFSCALAEQYASEYGESVLAHLPLIAGRTEPTQDNVHVLHRWYDLCSRMFCNHFLLACKKWANAHGMAFTGHMDKDHAPLGCVRGGGNFHLLRALRCLDIPGVDVIWRQLYPESSTADRDDMNAYNGFFPRYASSAAAQNGTDLAMAEVFGVAGPGLTYDVMRYTVGYLAVRGVSMFNLFNFPLGRSGALLAQELPVYTEEQMYYRDLPAFNRYMERLSYVSSLGKRVCTTGLYYPVRDFQGGLNAQAVSQAFDSIGRAMEARMIDFDLLDDDILQVAAGVDDGCLRIGSAVYRQLVLPEHASVPKKIQTVLERFVRGGGKVLYGLPDLPPVIRAEGVGLRAMHRKTENADLFCLFRESGESGLYRVHLGAESGYLLNLTDGTLQRFQTEGGEWSLSLAVGETAVILLTDENLCAQTCKEYTHPHTLPDAFQFRRQAELICDENGFKSIEHADKAVSVQRGDWACQVGSAYSGSCVYETSFTLPDEKCGKEGKLNLGDVRFTAAVSLNDTFLGTVFAPPYTLKIPQGVLCRRNTLKVVVTNTSANWYVHTDYFDKWNRNELSPYFETEKSYAKDSACGGLYGPVCLYTN